MFYDPRLWAFYADMNGDGLVTISDVWLWVKWLYFYPGDLVVYLIIYKTWTISMFFEMGFNSYGGLFSGTISFIAWMIGFALLFGWKAALEGNGKKENA